MYKEDILEDDKSRTLRNRNNLFKNKNLLYWYENLYNTQFSGIEGLSGKVIIEIGSGISPLKYFYDYVITSDVMNLDYLDHNFDCHHIDKYDSIPDGSVDIITMTNVLHHLYDPIVCLKKMHSKLKKSGIIIMLEPYFSILSNIIYKYLHHESSIFDIDNPQIKEVEGPLSSSNIAIPYMLFFSNRGWEKEIADIYDFSNTSINYYSALSYMVTGGISTKIPIPFFLYKWLFGLDRYLATEFPRIFSSFFIIRLVKKG
ncbi:MAG: methyltransferase domain-containing protein [Nitrospirae bacterium]|nr:methyltransferase domain-containing protein [Nitrospirota bacterium]